jgi:hypothetical protein
VGARGGQPYARCGPANWFGAGPRVASVDESGTNSNRFAEVELEFVVFTSEPVQFHRIATEVHTMRRRDVAAGDRCGAGRRREEGTEGAGRSGALRGGLVTGPQAVCIWLASRSSFSGSGALLRPSARTLATGLFFGSSEAQCSLAGEWGEQSVILFRRCAASRAATVALFTGFGGERARRDRFAHRKPANAGVAGNVCRAALIGSQAVRSPSSRHAS